VEQEREAVHARHVDVGQHDIDVGVGLKDLERFGAVVRELELVLAVPDVAPELLDDQILEVRFVVDDENLRWHQPVLPHGR